MRRAASPLGAALGWTTFGRFGLARLLRLGVAGSIPPLWAEIALLHFRGSYQSPFMWVPVGGLPLVLAGGMASTLIPDEERSRAAFRPLAWLLTLIGLGGTLFHLRGVGRQMGGFANWRYNFVTGPPVPAPAQVALLGALGAIAAAPAARGEAHRQVAAIRAVNALSYLLLAVEAGYNHWTGAYFNRVMFVPVVLGPVLALVHAGALAGARDARALEAPLSLAALAGGLVGFGFHVRNVRRRSGGFGWQNLFYGAPIVAPLQLTGQGVLGLLAALFGDDA